MDPLAVDKFSQDQYSLYDAPATHQPGRTSIKRPNEDLDNSGVKRPRVAVSRRRHVTYQRHPKPPYTYLGMAVVAIHTSPTRRLTLAGVQEYLAEMFPCFRGEYRGWRDSVRHNLSAHKCFVRIARSDAKNAKGCFWTVDLSLVPTNAFQKTGIKKHDGWAPTIFLHLGIQDITLPESHPTPQQRMPTPLQPKQESNSRPCTSFSIDNILSSADSLPLNVSEPPDARYNHPYSFLAYQTMTMQGTEPYYSPYPATLNKPVIFPEVFVPCYGEARPYASLASHHDQMLPDPVPEARDLSLRRCQPDQTLQESSPSQQHVNWNLSNPRSSQDVNIQLHDAADDNSSHPDPYPTHANHNQIVAARPQPTTFYRPFETECSSFLHQRAPFTHHYPQSTSSSAYDSDTTSDVSVPQPSSMTYTQPSPYPTDSSDACMGPPTTTPLHTSSRAWANLLDISCHSHSTTASVGVALDDLALFSDTSSNSSRPSIPFPVFSDDSRQSLPDMAEVIRDTQLMFSEIDVVSTSSGSSLPDDMTDMYHFGEAHQRVFRHGYQ